MTRQLDPRDTDPLHVDERVPSHRSGPISPLDGKPYRLTPETRPFSGPELAIAGLLLVLAILVAIFAASRSAATAIPADDRKTDLPSSGNPSLLIRLP